LPIKRKVTPEEFADELSAFSLGTVDSPDSAADTATEEEGKS